MLAGTGGELKAAIKISLLNTSTIRPGNAAVNGALNHEVQVVVSIIKKASCHAGLHTMITEDLRGYTYRLRD